MDNESNLTDETPIKMIVDFHRQAMPNPTVRQKTVQIGLHLDAIAKMLNEMEVVRSGPCCDDDPNFEVFKNMAQKVADFLVVGSFIPNIKDDAKFLETLAYQDVSRAGIAYTQGYNLIGAIEETASNQFKRFDDNGNPILDRFGKLQDSPNFVEVDYSKYTNKIIQGV